MSHWTAIPAATEYGPHQRGRDSRVEIIVAVRDVSAMSPADQCDNFYAMALLSAYPAAAFLDTLIMTAPQDIGGTR